MAKWHAFFVAIKRVIMKLLDLRRQIKADFKQLNIDETDADFIISEVLNVPKTEIVFVKDVSLTDCEEILRCVEKRKCNVPVNKIFGRAYFYGLKFKINNDVLAPRQDSELLVDTALKYIKQFNYNKVLDLCTGSGCLAIAIKKNANVDVVASDISKQALLIASENAVNNGAKIEFVESDMFKNINKKYDLIISNPPYISSKDIKELDKEVRENDPILALDGGETGVDFYKEICLHAEQHLLNNGMLILEIGDEQKRVVKDIFKNYQLVECLKDYGGNDRVLVFKV